MAKKTKPQAKVEEITQLIVFNLGDEEFGVNIGDVREIIRTGTTTPIPDSPQFIKGIINVRGEIVSVIDLETRLSLPAGKGIESRHVIITEQEKNIFGLLVGEVTEVLRIFENEIKKAPDLVMKIHEEYVTGVVTLENRLIILLDLGKVLSEEDLVELAEISRRHGGKVEARKEGIGRTES